MQAQLRDQGLGRPRHVQLTARAPISAIRESDTTRAPGTLGVSSRTGARAYGWRLSPFSSQQAASSARSASGRSLSSRRSCWIGCAARLRRDGQAANLRAQPTGDAARHRSVRVRLASVQSAPSRGAWQNAPGGRRAAARTRRSAEASAALGASGRRRFCPRSPSLCELGPSTVKLQDGSAEVTARGGAAIQGHPPGGEP